MEPENLQFWLETGLLALVQRTMASAQREFHRALTDLRRLQKDRGFVPQLAPESAADPVHAPSEIGFVSKDRQTAEEQIGFVPSKTHQTSPGMILLDPNSEDFYRATGFRTVEELRAYCITPFDEHSKAA